MLKKFALAVLTLLLTLLPLGGLVQAETLGTNLIADPSAEAGTTWSFDQYDDTGTAGTSTGVTSARVTPGHTGTYALQASITGYVDGDADWASPVVAVAPSTSYRFSDWYKSDTTTEVDMETDFANTADVPVQDGCDPANKVCYDQLLESVAPATDWTQATADFTTYPKAVSVSVYHLLRSNGTLTTDDYSLSTYTPTPFTKPMISVTFDDGWINQYTNAAPYMQSKGLIGTYYIISGSSVTAHDDQANIYMNSAQVMDLYNKGNEIGSHTVNHCDLANTTPAPALASANCPIPLSDARILSEMQDSKTNLQNLIGTNVTDFAYPYGTYNAHSVSVGQSLGYLSQRSTNPGDNTKDNLGNATELKMYEVDNTTTTAEVKGWMDQAVAQHTWLILCYHEVADAPAGAPADTSDLPYMATIQNFKDQMDYLATLKAQGTDVLTVAQALQEAQNEIAGTTTGGGTTTPAPLAISNPLGTGTAQTTATVTWLTNLAANSQVSYGLDANYGSTTTLDTQLIPNHAVNLTGLTAGTTYHFQVTSTDASNNTVHSGDLTFTTLPAGKPGDINNDGNVDRDDATLLFAHWGTNYPAGDLVQDGTINRDDATILFANWSK